MIALNRQPSSIEHPFECRVREIERTVEIILQYTECTINHHNYSEPLSTATNVNVNHLFYCL